MYLDYFWKMYNDKINKFSILYFKFKLFLFPITFIRMIIIYKKIE